MVGEFLHLLRLLPAEPPQEIVHQRVCQCLSPLLPPDRRRHQLHCADGAAADLNLGLAPVLQRLLAPQLGQELLVEMS